MGRNCILHPSLAFVLVSSSVFFFLNRAAGSDSQGSDASPGGNDTLTQCIMEHEV